MKRIIAFIALFLMLPSVVGCTDDAFGHETYTKIEEYDKIFELTEIRYNESAFEIFPESVNGLSVTDFYCEWELEIVGSAKAEIVLSVNYNQDDFNIEIARLKSLGNEKMVYDTDNFKYDAYVSVLGYTNTNYYVLIDEANTTMHYILLQLINIDDIDINKDFLPTGYGELGKVENISYNIYE